MAERLKRNHHLLSSFLKLNKKQQNSVVKHLDQDQVKFMCELCINLMNGNLPIDEATKRKLLSHKHKIRKLVDRKCVLKTKKRVIQRGGFVPALLAALAPAALSFLAEKYMNNG